VQAVPSTTTAARTATEQLLVEIWQEVLGPRVGVHDNFFDVGGHSISATRVISRIQKVFAVELPLRAIFERPTISQLAEALEMTLQTTAVRPEAELKPLSRGAADAFPLSFAQQRLWVLDRIQPENGAYNIPIILRLSGCLRADALERSIAQIAARHEILRTQFHTVKGEPQQAVVPQASVGLPVTDLSGFHGEERENRALEFVRKEIRRPFHLGRAPMMRAALVRMDAEDHILAVTVHHIAFDAWSGSILLAELETLYKAFAADERADLPVLPLQYGDYATWQRKLFSGEVLEERLSYWKKKLANIPGLVELPTDRPRPPVQTFSGDAVSTSISRPVAAGVRALSRREGVTSFMALLAGFSVLLGRYSRQDDIVVGTPVAGRQRTELESLLGVFVNTLVLRNDLSGDPTFRELLQRVRTTVIEGYANDIPFEKLVEALKPERDLSRNPLFQIMFALQNLPREKQEFPGLTVAPFRVPSGTEKFDLSVTLVERDESFYMNFSFNTDLFDKATAERLMMHYGQLLDSAVANPDRNISQIAALTEAEQKQITVDWNATEQEYGREACLQELIAEQAARGPDRVAAVFGAERMTYAELERRSNQLAHALRRHGVAPEVRVGIYLERSLDMLVALLGVLKAGGAYVPLDPAYPQDRIGFILQDAQASVLLTQSSLRDALPAHSARVLCLDSDGPAISAESTQAPLNQTRPDHVAYVLYTSGSTGKPKGVQVEHRNLVNFLTSMQRQPGLLQDDVLLAVTTLSFDIAGLELYLPLVTGAQIVLASREQASDGRQLLALMQQSRATLMQATPATWRMLLEAGWSGSPELKVLCGGEALPCDLAEQLLPRCAELWNMYGPTETTIWSSLYRVREASAGAAPIGKPIANTSFYILDAQRQPLPIGAAGELYIGGDGVARGYFRRPELTAERFVRDPFRNQPDARMYRTGDLARYRADGNVQFLGRADFQVKLRGFRIELGEIETVLAQHAAVQQAVVMVREDMPGDKRLVAYLVPRQDVDHAELRTHIKRHLPDYMVPSAFVKLPALPLTPNGKVDRRALPAPKPEQRAASAVIEPRSELESQILTIFRNTLGFDGIGIEDDFFELGGHSLLAARLISQVSDVAGREVPLSALFRGATVAALTEIIQKDVASHPDPLALCVQEGNGGPAIFAIASPGVETLGYALLARHIGTDQAVYKLQAQAPIAIERPFTEAELKQLSQDYIEAIRAIQPQGPYCFIGMCEGVQIAQQMILDLEAAGEKVGFFAILDTWVLQNSQIEWLWRLDYYRQRLRKLRRLPLANRVPLMSKAVRRNLKRAAQPRNAQVPTDWQRTYWPGKDFVNPRFQAPVVLFKRPKQPFYYVDDTTLGWGTRAMAGVEIHDIDFHHLEMLREPYVRTIGEVLRGRMLQIEKNANQSQPRNGDSPAIAATGPGA
jgi:amino acid adenylation domain-containing protein